MDQIIKYIENYYYSFRTLIVISFIIASSLMGFDYFIEKGINNYLYRCLLYSIILIIWLLFWFYKRNQFPRNSNKIGIIIAIQTENEKQKIRIKDDLVKELDSLLQSNKIDFINIVTLNDFQSKYLSDIIDRFLKKHKEILKNIRKISIDKVKEVKSWNNLRKKLNGHLYIWGTVKERKEIENTYVLKIHALVTHKVVDINTQKHLSKDIALVFPKEIGIYEKTEKSGFEITANLLYLAARFIIGNAAYISGDPYIAYKLHNGLKEQLLTFKPLPPNLEYMFKDLDNIISKDLTQSEEIPC